jgi:LPXTG-motif cell wall-anchored protein
MRSRRIISTLIGAGIVAATTVGAVPAVALPAWTPYTTHTVDCDMFSSPSTDIPIYAGQGAVITFSPATCRSANWSGLGTGLSDNNSLSGTTTVTIEADSIACGLGVFIVGDGSGPGGNEYEFLTFSGCEAAPAGAPEAPAAAPLPDTGIDAMQAGLLAAGAGVLALAGLALAGVALKTNRRHSA